MKGPTPDKFQPRVLLIWMVIFAAIVALWFMNPANTANVREMSVTEVLQAAGQGTISNGVIKSDGSGGKDWTVITGKLRGEDGNLVDFRAAGRVPDASFRELQETGAFKERPAGNVWQQVIIGLLPFVIIIGLLYFLFVRQIRMAGRGALNFGKSRAKMLTRDRDRITFSDVAGCDEAKEEVHEIVDFLKDPKKFQKVGGRIPKGILMVGPPGTGKTLLAKAIAGEADVPFFTISGSDFVEMFVGVGASRVRDMFEQGRKNAPCLIFIDEIDAVGRQRGAGLGGGNDEREQTLNSLLVEMDGFDTTEGVIIIAATNRPDVLDNALLRPGRFDRQVYIDLPDLVGREQILRVHARKLPLSEDVDLAVVARGTPGLSGAELANLLNEGALMAARRNKKKIDMLDIEEAREKVQFGRERRRIMDDEDKKIVAYHEAGHALVQAAVDDGQLPVHKVTIIPRGGSLGSTMFIPKKDMLNYGKRRLLNNLAGLMGGRAAEEVAIGDITSGASGDIKQATKIARHMVCDWGMSPLGPVALGENQETLFLGREISRSQNYSESTAVKIDAEIHRIVDEQYDRARKILQEKRAALDYLASALLEHETLDGHHVVEILEFGEIRTPVTKKTPPPLEPAKARAPRDDASKKPKEVPPSAEPSGAPA
ncbi:ATP-dependent zinc metalloprotease FtsH [Opitutales bacterium ASA1]|nr:ATP-dependent zinc metalloprotease FtsH [Opitutales bacterium ASA1]